MRGLGKCHITHLARRTFFPQKFYPRVRQPTHRAGKIFRVEKMLGEHRRGFDAPRSGTVLRVLYAMRL